MPPTVRREIVLPVGRERAWALLTDPAELREWLRTRDQDDVTEDRAPVDDEPDTTVLPDVAEDGDGDEAAEGTDADGTDVDGTDAAETAEQDGRTAGTSAAEATDPATWATQIRAVSDSSPGSPMTILATEPSASRSSESGSSSGSMTG